MLIERYALEVVRLARTIPLTLALAPATAKANDTPSIAFAPRFAKSKKLPRPNTF